MTNEGRQQSAAEELARAREELAAARHLLGLGLGRIALTRAYFACFHAARAALFARDIEPKSHSGAVTLFNLHFVKTGLASIGCSALLARLQKYREAADYGDAFFVDDATVRVEVDAAEAFVREVDGINAAGG
ncbi:MAG: hypothetical protein A2138_21050 [Deltaproteobacteria bacterium RBG_16_71_12]|nr:MAG: hypothetical protein A2138_21050 [Deltaproteobacteria bacterium RBG_16_71_12]